MKVFPKRERSLRANALREHISIKLKDGWNPFTWSESHFRHPFFDKISRKFKRVYWIPDNHEFYRGVDISILEEPVKIEIRENIFLVNNITETIDDVDFFFTALWSKIRPEDAFYIEQHVSDFKLIKYKGAPFTAFEFNKLFNQSFHFLKNAIEESTSKRKIVVTHQCPTQKANAKEFQTSQISGAFVVELYDFIFDSPIDYWIFGHTHRNEPEVNINGTRVVCNQVGYVNWKENKTFKFNSFFEI